MQTPNVVYVTATGHNPDALASLIADMSAAQGDSEQQPQCPLPPAVLAEAPLMARFHTACNLN
jgi:hypothetical protein